MEHIAVDWSIRFGDLLVIISGVAAILLYAFRIGGWKRDFDGIKRDITEMKESQKGMNALLTQVAVQKNRLDGIEDLIGKMIGWIDDLRRGDGFILGAHRQQRGD